MDFTIQNGTLSLTVSDYGAQMTALQKDGKDYLWGGDPKYWDEHAPILFPFVARLTNETYTLNGTPHHMKIHGFAKYMIWKVVEKKTDRICLELCDSEETREAYPYRFCLRLTYQLEDNAAVMKFEVENRSDSRMYFGLGGHMGFRVPLEEELAFTDYALEFPLASHPDLVGFTDACFLNGENKEYPLSDGRRIQLRHDLFDHDAIVLQNMPSSVTLKSEKGSRSVTVDYPDFRYLGIWHMPHTDAPYVCIEPWSSLPARQDVIEEFSCKSDMNRLAPGAVYHSSIRITLQ